MGVVKIPVNGKCPCGGDKKYKKCCKTIDEANQKGVTILTRAYDTKGDDFFSRFLFQMSQIRDCIVPIEERPKYDRSYSGVFQNLLEAKLAKEHTIRLLEQHVRDVEEGKVATIKNQQMTVSEPINDDLNLYVKDFFIRGIIATNTLFSHARYMGFPIHGLCDEQEKKRRKALQNFPLAADDPKTQQLLRLIDGHSTWYGLFRKLRHQIEHEGWQLPEVGYRPIPGNRVEAVFPKIYDLAIVDLLNLCWNNMTVFCEDTMVVLASFKLRDELTIVHIPKEQRDPHWPITYAVRLKQFPGTPFQHS